MSYFSYFRHLFAFVTWRAPYHIPLARVRLGQTYVCPGRLLNHFRNLKWNVLLNMRIRSWIMHLYMLNKYSNFLSYLNGLFQNRDLLVVTVDNCKDYLIEMYINIPNICWDILDHALVHCHPLGRMSPTVKKQFHSTNHCKIIAKYICLHVLYSTNNFCSTVQAFKNRILILNPYMYTRCELAKAS